MTLCPYCHHWLSLCRCPVGFFPTEKSIGTNPGKTQFAGEKDCSIDHGPTIEISPARQASQGYAGTTPGQAPCSAGVACDSHGHSSVRGPLTLDDKGRCCGRKPIVIAALFVDPTGVYSNLPGVDAWGMDRDARKYTGPYPVVAHPPCERWGRYWSGGPSAAVRRLKGDDGGCFAAALDAVRKYGGVLEHPEASHAWSAHSLRSPPKFGGWVAADFTGGWTCCVEQGHYGHRARKATWLYAFGVSLPSLKWGTSGKRERLDQGFHSQAERRRSIRTGICQRLSKKQRSATPIGFRDLLLSIARNSHPAAGTLSERCADATSRESALA